MIPNDGVRKSIEEHGFKMKWCTYLEMLRNANAHFTSKNGDEYKQLLTQCLPNRAVALLTALKNYKKYEWIMVRMKIVITIAGMKHHSTLY